MHTHTGMHESEATRIEAVVSAALVYLGDAVSSLLRQLLFDFLQLGYQIVACCVYRRNLTCWMSAPIFATPIKASHLLA